MKEIIVRSFVVLMLTSLFTAKPAAQTDIRNIKFENISIKDGLSQSSPNCIFQDSKGLIWIGTEDGLNKYDAYSFYVYKPDANDPFSISHSRILTICEDSLQNLWVGTNGGGLNKYERNSGNFTHFHYVENESNSLSHDVVNSILQLRSDELWIGTDQGISVLNPGSAQFVDIGKEKPYLDILSGLSINTFAYDGSGVMWIGTSSGLFQCDLLSETAKAVEQDSLAEFPLQNVAIQSLLIDKDQNLWIGTDSGLTILDPDSHTVILPDTAFNISNYQQRFNIRALQHDEYGHIWIGTYGNGLYIYLPESNHFINYSYDHINPYSISNNEILSIFADYSGIIWVGSNGLDKYNPKKEKFRLYDYVPYTNDNLMFRNIHPIYEDPDNVLWIGSKSDGIHVLDRGNKTYTHLTHDPDNPNSLPSNKIRAILEYPENVMWIGTEDQGLCKVILNEARNPIEYIHYQNSQSDLNSLSGNTIYDLFINNAGNLWIGTDNGLTIMDIETETFTRHQPDPENPSSISNTTAYSIYADHSGDIWIATDFGLNRYDPEINGFIHYFHEEENKNSIIHNEIMAFHEDTEGYLWIGTYGYGIDRFDKSTQEFKHYSHIDELSKAVVYGILEDRDKNLWISTNNGIIRFNSQTEQVKVFSIEDGLQSNEFNGTSYLKSNSGEMFFGGQYGFNSFFPEEVLIDSITPNIILTELLVNNKTVIPGEESPIKKYISEVDEIILNHRENNFTLYFSALHYANPSHNQYRYQLVGFDEQWIDAGNKRFVSYTNLPYRSYTFRIIAANSDGVWNETGLSLRIKIKPPFWSTIWFKFVVVILLALLAFYWYKRRMKYIEKQKQLLNEKVETSNYELEEVKNKLTTQQEEITIQKQELKLRERDQRELLWFNQGISLFSDIISKNKHDLERLCQTVINQLIEYVEAEQGGIFLIQDEDESEAYLKLIASHAYPNEKINKQFKPGESYIGTCYKEKQFLEIDNISEAYAILESGLGKGILKHLLLAPMMVGDNCIGVIELGSFKKLKGFKVSFVEKMIETFASTINTEQANLKMKKIINESENQAKEIQEREEQLRIQLELNMVKQEEAQLRESEYNQLIEEASNREKELEKQIQQLQETVDSLKKNKDQET